MLQRENQWLTRGLQGKCVSGKAKGGRTLQGGRGDSEVVSFLPLGALGGEFGLQCPKGCFPGGSAVKNQPADAGDAGDMASIPGSGRSPWRSEWKPTPVFLPGGSHGQRSLAGYSPCGHEQLDTTEHAHARPRGRSNPCHIQGGSPVSQPREQAPQPLQFYGEETGPWVLSKPPGQH